MWGIVSHPNIKENESSHRGHRRCLSRITGLQGFESRWLFFKKNFQGPDLGKTFRNFHNVTLTSIKVLRKPTDFLLWSHLVGVLTIQWLIIFWFKLLPPECLTRHPAVRHFSQWLNWFGFHTAWGLNIQILNTYLRYSDISRCQNSLGRQRWLVNQKLCNLLWLELVNALSLSLCVCRHT